MTTTRNKISIEETIYIENKIKSQAYKGSEYITIIQDDDIISIKIDEIFSIILSLRRFIENGEITED